MNLKRKIPPAPQKAPYSAEKAPGKRHKRHAKRSGRKSDRFLFYYKTQKISSLYKGYFYFFSLNYLNLSRLPQGAATSQSPPYSRLPLGGSCPQSGLKRSIMSYSRLPPSGFSCRAAVSRQLSCPRSGLKRSIVPYSRLPLGGKLSTKLTDEGAATLTLLKNFKQTDSRPPWLPLWGSCPQSGLKRTPPIFSDFSRKK